MFILERWSVRNGKDIRDGVAGLGDPCEYDAARTLFGAILAADARFVPPQISVTNDLTRLRKR